MRYSLLGGSYVARSKISNAQRCINYYPELNPQDAPVPFTYYPRPGMPLAIAAPAGNAMTVRCLYRASNGTGYAVIGQTVYVVNSNWTLTQIGTMVTFGSGPCRMIDNGTTALLADGTPNGYEIVLATNAFSQIVDPTGAWNGANTFGFLDTFIVWNEPNTIDFKSTLSNSVSFDALYFAGKIGYPDKLVALNVIRREILLLGALKSEIWYNAGAATFPFAILPGAYIEHGCVAPYSVASFDINTLWLGQDLSGNGIVLQLKAYDVQKISNHALELAIKNMQKAGADISDAIGYTYQIEGHYFYVLSFPSGNETWVYDSSLEGTHMSPWHQRAWTDANGNFNRDRSNCGAFINDRFVVGDHSNGQIYFLDNDYYLDDVDPSAPSPIVKLRTFPHVLKALDPAVSTAMLIDTDGKRVMFTNFMVDLECGQAPLNADGSEAQVSMRYSVDRGLTFSTTLLRGMGEPGEFGTYPTWTAMGLSRDMIFEVFHSIAGPCALQGAWVKSEIQQS